MIQTNRKPVPIDVLLSWAYRDELPKAIEHGGLGLVSLPQQPIWRMGVFGARIDNWDHEPGYPAIMGSPHPDALLIDEEVQRLPNADIDWAESREYLMGDGWRLTDEDDPILVNMTVRTVELVIMHAKMGTRPWWNAIGHPRRVIGGNGKHVTMKKDRSPDQLYDDHCPLTWSPMPREVASDRAEYAVWHEALCGLARSLAAILGEHLPEEPAAPRAPWYGFSVPRVWSGIAWSGQ